MPFQSNKKKETLTDNVIIYFIFLMLLFIKSIKDLLEIFSYGFLKKEILTNESNIGFDIKIKIR